MTKTLPMRSIRRLRSAFTLMEMMIVVSIIMLLAFLLLSVLTATSAQKLNLECQNNLKQVFTGMTSWAADRSGAIPPYFERKNNPYDVESDNMINSMTAFRSDGDRLAKGNSKRRLPHNLAALVVDRALQQTRNLYCPGSTNHSFGESENTSPSLAYDEFIPDVRDTNDDVKSTAPKETFIGYLYQGRRLYRNSQSQLVPGEMFMMDVFYDSQSVFHDIGSDIGWNVMYGGGFIEYKVNRDIYKQLGDQPVIGKSYDEFFKIRKALERKN